MERFDASWRARAAVVPASRGDVDWMVKERHYLHRWPGFVTDSYALLIDGRPTGCMIFALPPEQTCTRYGCEVWELARLWISDDVPGNAETYFIGQVFRKLRKRTTPQLIVSYADPSKGHEGVIYRAANFIYDGMTNPGVEYRKSLNQKNLWGEETYMRFARKGHIRRYGKSNGDDIERIPRESKHRYIYRLQGANGRA